MTTTFRERIEGMTAGQFEIAFDGPIAMIYQPGAGTAVRCICKAPCDDLEGQANATGIVLSVATARLVASDELPRNMARVMLNLQEGPATVERMEREETIQWRNRLRDAKAVLSAIQAAAMEGV